jgi:hypothetical protein
MKFDRSAAADLWRNTLSQIPTTFGRLIYLASLRDQNTGAYHHHGLEQLFGPEQAEQTLRLAVLQSGTAKEGSGRLFGRIKRG